MAFKKKVFKLRFAYIKSVQLTVPVIMVLLYWVKRYVINIFSISWKDKDAVSITLWPTTFEQECGEQITLTEMRRLSAF